MTTIAVRDGIIAADSAIYDGTVHIGSVAKLHKIKHGIFGGAGIMRELCIMRKWIEDDEAPLFNNSPDSLKDITASGLLLIPNKKIICFEGTSVFDIAASFQAVGSGTQIAIGAMAMGATAEQAVRIACEYDQASYGPVITMKI